MSGRQAQNRSTQRSRTFGASNALTGRHLIWGNTIEKARFPSAQSTTPLSRVLPGHLQTAFSYPCLSRRRDAGTGTGASFARPIRLPLLRRLRPGSSRHPGQLRPRPCRGPLLMKDPLTRPSRPRLYSPEPLIHVSFPVSPARSYATPLPPLWSCAQGAKP